MVQIGHEGMTVVICDVCGELRCMVKEENAYKWLDSHKARSHKVAAIAAKVATAKPRKRAEAEATEAKPVAFHVGDVVTAGNSRTEYTVLDVRERSKRGHAGTELEVTTKNNRVRVLHVERDNVTRVKARRGRPKKTA